MANKVEIIFEGVDRISKSVSGIENSFRTLGASALRLGGALGVAFSVREILDTADTYKLLQNRLRIVTDSTENLAEVTDELYAISQRSRNSFASTADLYARIARSSDELGVSQERLLGVTETINQAIQVSGATATEASAGLIQLAQGLASGALRGDELRSVMEQMPRLARAISEGMGITIGELRTLGGEGKITAEVVINALESQSAAIQKEFDQMESTVGQSITVLGNSMTLFIGRLDSATGASNLLAESLQGVSHWIDSLGNNPFPFEQQITKAQANLDQFIQQLGVMGISVNDLVQAQIDGSTEYDAVLKGMNSSLDETIQRYTFLTNEVDKYRAAQEKALGVGTGGTDNGLREITVPKRALIDTTDVLKAVEKEAEQRQKHIQDIIRSLETDNERIAREFADIMELYEQGFLTEDTVNRFIDSVLQPIEVTATKMKDKVKEGTDYMKTLTDQAARNMQDIWADFFFDPFEDGLNGMLRKFIDVIRRMIAEAAAAKLIEKLFGGKKDEGGGGNGFLDAILGGLFGSIGGGSVPGRAKGGFVDPGQLTRINENEPEFLLTSDRSQVIPLSQAAAMGVGGGGGGIVYAPTTQLNVSSEPISKNELETLLINNNEAQMAEFNRRLKNGDFNG